VEIRCADDHRLQPGADRLRSHPGPGAVRP